jgi:hypothetical protein
VIDLAQQTWPQIPSGSKRRDVIPGGQCAESASFIQIPGQEGKEIDLPPVYRQLNAVRLFGRALLVIPKLRSQSTQMEVSKRTLAR